jgi:hypothetical protein
MVAFGTSAIRKWRNVEQSCEIAEVSSRYKIEAQFQTYA